MPVSFDFFLSISFCRFLSFGYFAGLLGPDYILGALGQLQLLYLSLSSIFSPTLRADFYERIFKPGCALRPKPSLAYSEPDSDR